MINRAAFTGQSKVWGLDETDRRHWGSARLGSAQSKSGAGRGTARRWDGQEI